MLRFLSYLFRSNRDDTAATNSGRTSILPPGTTIIRVRAWSALHGSLLAAVSVADCDTAAMLKRSVLQQLPPQEAGLDTELLFQGKKLPADNSLRALGFEQDAEVQVVYVRTASTVKLSRSTMRVKAGNDAGIIHVGGVRQNPSFGQCPPALGDAWEVDLRSFGGDYELVFEGACNPHHGTFSVHIGGRHLGDIDQYCWQDVYPAKHCLQWKDSEPGAHVLRAVVAGTNADSLGHWVCVQNIHIVPV